MPIYDYECYHCGKRHELMRPVAQRDWQFPCTCGARLHRVVSAPAMVELDAATGGRQVLHRDARRRV